MEQTLSSASAAPIMAKTKISPTMALIKNALKIYRERFWSFVGMGLTPLLGMIPLALVLGIYAGMNFFIKNWMVAKIASIILGILGLISIIAMIYIALAAQAGFILMLKDSALKIGEAFKAGRRYAWLLGIIELATGFLIMLWSILFIIPGIIFAVYYSLVAFVLLIEDRKDKTALKRSKELVKGYWWAIAGRFLLVGLIGLVIIIILSLPLLAMEEKSVQFQIFNQVVGIFEFLYGLFFTIYSYLIFKDLQQIKARQ